MEPDYFAQDQYKELDINARVLDDLSAAAPRTTQTELRNLLGCFLFSEDDVFKRIGVLSGGERNRYALARMLLHPSNFLLLDEPTNHLDIRAKDVLLEALEKFTGTIVFVSHDRYFIEHLATRVFEIAEGEVRVFPGNYHDYLWRKGGEQKRPHAERRSDRGSAGGADSYACAGSSAKRINPLKLKQLEDQAQSLEEQIASLESEIQQSETALSTFVGAEEALRLSTLLAEQREQLEKAMSEWEQVTGQIEATA